MLILSLFACFGSCGKKAQDSAGDTAAQEVVEDTAVEEVEDTSVQDTAAEDTAEEVIEQSDTAE